MMRLVAAGLVVATLGCGMPPSARVVRHGDVSELRGATRFVVLPVARTTVDPSAREERLARTFHERLVGVGRTYGLDVVVADGPTDGRIVLVPRFVEVADRAVGINPSVFTRLEVTVMTPDRRPLEVIELRNEARALWATDCTTAYWPLRDCTGYGVGVDPVTWNGVTLGADLADYLRYRSTGETRGPHT